jgi:hypothetical protein
MRGGNGKCGIVRFFAGVPGPSDTIGNHVDSYEHLKSLKNSIGVEIFSWDGWLKDVAKMRTPLLNRLM